MPRVGSQDTRQHASGSPPVAIRKLAGGIQDHDIEFSLAFRQSPLSRIYGVAGVGIASVEKQDPRPNMNGLLITPGSNKLFPLLQ
jgi:hypothetical protein